MSVYRVTSPALGLDHGTWSGPSPVHALAAMLTAAGYHAAAEPGLQVALFGSQEPGRWHLCVEPEAARRMARLGLDARRFRVEELQPIAMGLFD